MKLLPHFETTWSVVDEELSNDRYLLVDVYAQLGGRTFLLGDMHYPRGKVFPDYLSINTRLIRVTKGLMDPDDL
jgi:hypothetical protein